jgi:hypothetical protein
MPLDGSAAKPLTNPLVWAVLAALVLSAVYFDAFPYDVLAYHGPFSALAAGLPRLADFRLSPFLEHRFQGFPPLWRWLMAPGLGLGLPRLLALPNALALLVLARTARITLRLPWFVTVAAALLFPIALFNFRTAYQDFFVGALATAAVLLLAHALRQWLEAGLGARSAWAALPLLLAISLTKYQGLFLSLLALALAGLASLALGWRRPRPGTSLWSSPLPPLLLALLLCGLHPLHNLLQHHNPFFPVAVGPFPGAETKGTSESPAYTLALGPLRTFLNHWLSASELDWIARGVVPRYNLDQAGSQIQYGGLIEPRAFKGAVRTGGSFGPAWLAAMAAYAVAFARALADWRRVGRPSFQGWPVLAVAPFVLLGAGLPQSHELRYYLPLLLLPALTALGWWWAQGGRRWLQTGLLAFLAVALLLNFSQPLYSTAKGLLRGQGLHYALTYPVRDLPPAAACLRQGQRRPGSEPTLAFPMGLAFACRLQLPAEIHVVEGVD